MGLFDMLKKRPKENSGQKTETKKYELPPKNREKYEEAILLSLYDGIQYPSGGYVTYFQYDFNIQDPSTLHEKYISLGLLTKATFLETCAKCLVKELKELSEKYGVSTKGKKSVLIERMDLELPEDVKINFATYKRYYVLSDEGNKFVNQYKDYITVYRNRINFGVSLDEYHSLKKEMDNRSMFDILWAILQKKAISPNVTNGDMAFINLHRANICTYEMNHTNRNLESRIMQYDLSYVYYILNTSIEIDFIISMRSNPLYDDSNKEFTTEDFFIPGVTERLDKYKGFYKDLDLEFIPNERNMRYTICSKDLFRKILESYENRSFDSIVYNDIINKNIQRLYRKLVKK